MQHLTTVTCPVCGAIFDEIRHPDPEPSALGIAMLAGDGRRMHKAASPECTKDERWMDGWVLNTQFVPSN